MSFLSTIFSIVLTRKHGIKKSQVNKVYLIYVFCVVLRSLLAKVSHGERQK